MFLWEACEVVKSEPGIYSPLHFAEGFFLFKEGFIKDL